MKKIIITILAISLLAISTVRAETDNLAPYLLTTGIVLTIDGFNPRRRSHGNHVKQGEAVSIDIETGEIRTIEKQTDGLEAGMGVGFFIIGLSMIIN